MLREQQAQNQDLWNKTAGSGYVFIVLLQHCIRADLYLLQQNCICAVLYLLQQNCICDVLYPLIFPTYVL